MRNKRVKSSKLAVKTANIIRKDRALKIPSRKVARKLALELGLIGALVCMTSCSMEGAYNPDGYAIRCQGRGCDKFTEYAATLINETKLQDPKDSPFFTNQNKRDNKKSWIEGLFRPSNQGGK